MLISPSPIPFKCDRKIIALYRQRARDRIRRARKVDPLTRRLMIDDALMWRSFANEWSRKAKGVSRQ